MSTPGVPGEIACGGYKRPACTRRTSRHEKADNQDDDRQRVDPDAQHVHEREYHIPRTELQRNKVIAESTEEQRRQQVDHHDHAVRRDELVGSFQG